MDSKELFDNAVKELEELGLLDGHVDIRDVCSGIAITMLHNLKEQVSKKEAHAD